MNHVIIIGLSWASVGITHILRKNNIPFQILEKRKDFESCGFGVSFSGTKHDFHLPWFSRSDHHLIELLRYYGLEKEVVTFPNAVIIQDHSGKQSKNFDTNRLSFRKPWRDFIEAVIGKNTLKFQKPVASMRKNLEKKRWMFLDKSTSKTMIDDVQSRTLETNVVIIADQAEFATSLINSNKSLDKFRPYIADRELHIDDATIGISDSITPNFEIQSSDHKEWMSSKNINSQAIAKAVFCKNSEIENRMKAISKLSIENLESHLAPNPELKFLLDAKYAVGLAGPAVSGGLVNDQLESGIQIAEEVIKRKMF